MPLSEMLMIALVIKRDYEIRTVLVLNYPEVNLL
jgi:hypothetical protein